MKPTLTLSVIAFLLILLGASGCYYDNEEDLYPVPFVPLCDTLSISYQTHVQPLLATHCYTCHDAASQFGNVNLEVFSSLQIFAQNGSLLGALSHLPDYSPMPQGGNRLPDCEIAQINAWIQAGSPQN